MASSSLNGADLLLLLLPLLPPPSWLNTAELSRARPARRQPSQASQQPAA